MPRFTTSANCTGTLSAAQKTPETARPRSETQPEWGKRGRPPPAMRGPEAATPRVTRYSATASPPGSILRRGGREQDEGDARRDAKRAGAMPAGPYYRSRNATAGLRLRPALVPAARGGYLPPPCPAPAR